MRTAGPVEAPRRSSLVEMARRKVVAEIERDDACLARILRRPSARGLDHGALTRLAASVTDDRALLDELSAEADRTTTLAELRTVAASVHRLRPEIYSIAVAQVQDLTALIGTAQAYAASLAAFDVVVTQRETAGQDVTSVRIDLMAARLLNSEAALAIPEARDAALSLTARSTRIELRAVMGEVPRISDLLDRVEETVLLVELALAAPAVGRVDIATLAGTFHVHEPTRSA